MFLFFVNNAGINKKRRDILRKKRICLADIMNNIGEEKLLRNIFLYVTPISGQIQLQIPLSTYPS
eukprot:Pgem_evm1s3095